MKSPLFLQGGLLDGHIERSGAIAGFMQASGQTKLSRTYVVFHRYYVVSL